MGCLTNILAIGLLAIPIDFLPLHGQVGRTMLAPSDLFPPDAPLAYPGYGPGQVGRNP